MNLRICEHVKVVNKGARVGYHPALFGVDLITSYPTDTRYWGIINSFLPQRCVGDFLI